MGSDHNHHMDVRALNPGCAASARRTPCALTELSRLAHAIYADASAETAARTARDLHIGYLFVGPDEVRSNPADGIAKFDRRPDLFRPVFSNSKARIYEIVQR